MNGSSVDTHSLRTENSLHNRLRFSAAQQAEGLFEELLKLSTVSTIEPVEQMAPEPETSQLVDTSQSQNSSKSASESNDKPKQDEALEPNSVLEVPLCVMPGTCPTIQQPADTQVEPAIEATVETNAKQPAIAQPTNEAPINLTQQQQADPSIAASNPAIDSSNQVEAATAETDFDTLRPEVQPIGTDVHRSRETRNPKVVDEKSASHPETQATASSDKLRERNAPKSQETHSQENLQSQNAALSPADVTQEVTPDSDDAEKPKWYQDKGQNNRQDVNNSLADQVAQRNESRATAEELDSNALRATEGNSAAANRTDLGMTAAASPTLSSQVGPDSMLAAAMNAGLNGFNPSANQSAVASNATESSVQGIGAVGGRADATTVNSSSSASDSGLQNQNGSSSGSRAAVHSQEAGANPEAKTDQPVRQLTQQERVRLVQRVARSFSRLGPEGGQVTLKLHPPQLGVLNISIKIDGQSMSARLQTETSAAREVLLEHLPSLKERLSQQGISVEKFQVEVANNDLTASSSFNSGQGFQDSSSHSRDNSQATQVDYRRLSRDSAARRPLAPNNPLAGSQVPGRPRSLTDRTLDIRA